MPSLFLRGIYLGSIKGVLFDKDGTLSNSEKHLTDLARLRVENSISLLKQKQLTELELSRFRILINKVYGISSEGLCPNSCIAIASRDHNIISTATIFSLFGANWPESIYLANQAFISVDKIINTKVQDTRPIIPGAKKILNDLNKAGAICTLISNDSKKGIEEFIQINNLEGTFKFFWSAEDYPSKPDPIAVKNLCKKINLIPSDCALIGDADTDLKMGKEANIGIILGFQGGWTNQPSLSEKKNILSSWDELTIK